MKSIEIGITMMVFTLFLSCKSSINPTTTIGRQDDTVSTGSDQQSESTYDTDDTDARSESTYNSQETNPQTESTYDTGNTDQQTESTYDDPVQTNQQQTDSTYDSGRTVDTDPIGAPPMEAEHTEEMQYNGTTGSNTGAREMEMSGASDKDYEPMFSYLEMTDGQIQQFTSAMEAYSNNANMDSASRMDSTIEEKQDDVLSVILSQVQMEKYEAWKRDN
jgi:hypothetical protein